MSDDTDGQLINFPVGTDVTDRPPQLPDPGRLFPDVGERSGIPPESPEETTLELPAVPAAPRPEAALVFSREIPLADPGGISAEEIAGGEYVQPRSLADRLGDWLEYRLEVARDRHAGEASFREAEIARKTALLEARTAQETAMMEQNGKLRAAQMKAKADKAAAHGKTDTARSSNSGLGSDKGRSKAGGGGSGSSGHSGRGGGSGRDPGTNRSGGGPGHGPGSSNSPKGAGKGSDRSTGGRGGASKGHEPSGGSKGRQNGSGGSGPGKSNSGKGSSGGTGKNGSGGSGSGKGGTSKDSPASSPRAERTRGRQERAAARQTARHQRRSAHLADRSKDRDQDRTNRQAEREEHRAAKAERKAARKAKRKAAQAADDRTTLSAAVAEEAQRRWDKRRAAAKDKPAKDGEAAESDTGAKGSGNGSDATAEKAPGDGPDGASKAAKDGKEGDGPGKDSKAGDGPSGGSTKRPRFRRRRTGGTGRAERRERTRRTGRTGRAGHGRPADSPFGAQDSTPTTEWPEHDTRPPKPAAQGEDDIVDAVIVDDPSDPFGAYVSRPAGLPRAPEPHTERPGTTRPTAQEDPVASEVRTTASGQSGLAAKHRTDITFDEYLMEIVNIAIAAALDKDRAQDLAVALGKVADALRAMAADLVGDHNIATEVVGQVLDLADAAARMKQLAERCATECEIASEAARIAATAVGRTYGEDIQAMDDAGLAHASAAAHHD